FFFFSSTAVLVHLPSFPTRRSSDLFGDAALRFTSGAIATLLLVLCSPFINPKQRDDEPKPAASVAPEQSERVGVKLRRGDTLASDRKSTRLNSSHDQISYAVFCLKK